MTSSTSVSFWRLLAYIRPYRRRYLMGAAALILVDVAQIAATYVIRYAVNEIEGKPADHAAAVWMHEIARTAGWSFLLVAAVLFVLLYVVQGGCRYLWRIGMTMSSQYIGRDMRRELFGNLVRQEHAYFDRNRTGEFLSIATSDVESIRMFLGMGLLLLLDAAIYFLIIPPILLAEHWQIALMTLAPLPFIPILSNRLGNVVHVRSEACQEQLAAIAARARESVAGIKVVKGFVQQERDIAHFDSLCREALDRYVARAKVQMLLHPLMDFIGHTIVFLMILLGGKAVLAGQIDFGLYLQMILLVRHLTWPLLAIGMVLSLAFRATASHERFRRVCDREAAIRDQSASGGEVTVRGRIEFRNLTFTYPGVEAPALWEVDLVIPAGSTVGLVGEVGSGKSTLAELVPRFYEAPPGQVLVDDVPVERIPLGTLRRAVAHVPQETFLFSKSIAGNIALSLEALDMDRVMETAVVAGLEADVAGFEAGYETLLGERGVNLSGGQKQRVSIARALIVEAPILILDDCLSAVDTKTEAWILAGLRRWVASRTCMVIAHRLSAVKEADLICVLERGRIVERGTHDQLVAAGGWYAATYAHQLLEEAYREQDGV